MAAEEELRRRLETLPEAGRKFFKAGFAVASTVSPAVRDSIIDEVVAAFEQGRRDLGSPEIKQRTGLTESDANSVFSAFTLVIALISDSNATAEEFASTARGIVFEAQDEAVALAVAKSVSSRREEIKKTIAKAQLGSAVLPSLEAFDVAIDVRLRLEKGKVVTKVPVAIVHIDTDANGQELWVQLTQADVEDMLKKLKEAESDLKSAQAFVSDRT